MSIGLSLLTGVHLLLVDLAAAAPLLAAFVEWRRAASPTQTVRWARHLLWTALLSLLVGSAIGLLVGWWLWTDAWGQALQRMPSKVYYGIWEWVFSAVLLVGHLRWLYVAPIVGHIGRAMRTAMGLLAATNLLYHFPVLFAVVTELVHAGQWQGARLSAAEFRHLLVNTSAASRATHAVLASVAVSGVYVSLIASLYEPDEDGRYRRWVTWGGCWAAVPTALQWLVGFWIVTQLPVHASQRLLGGDPPATAVFVVGLGTSLWLTHLAVTMAFGEATRRQVRLAAVMAVVTVLLMTFASQRVLSPVSQARTTSSTSMLSGICYTAYKW